MLSIFLAVHPLTRIQFILTLYTTTMPRFGYRSRPFHFRSSFYPCLDPCFSQQSYFTHLDSPTPWMDRAFSRADGPGATRGVRQRGGTEEQGFGPSYLPVKWRDRDLGYSRTLPLRPKVSTSMSMVTPTPTPRMCMNVPRTAHLPAASHILLRKTVGSHISPPKRPTCRICGQGLNFPYGAATSHQTSVQSEASASGRTSLVVPRRLLRHKNTTFSNSS